MNEVNICDKSTFIPISFYVKNNTLLEKYINVSDYIRVIKKLSHTDDEQEIFDNFKKLVPDINKNNFIYEIKNYIDNNPIMAKKIFDNLDSKNFCIETSELSDSELKIYSNVYSKIKDEYIRWDLFRFEVFKELFNNIPKNRLLNKDDYLFFFNFFRKYKSCCNLNFIKQLSFEMKVAFPENKVSKSYKSMKTYIEILKKYENIYSLGDSLDKYNLIAKIFNINIVNIPFSGSMYDEIVETNTIKLNENEQKRITDNIHLLLKNNKGFNSLISDIKNNKKVIITDFGLHGKAYLTIMYIINQVVYSKQYHNVTYLHLTTDILKSDDSSENFLKKNIDFGVKKYETNMLYLQVETGEFMPYFSNSELSDSRCVAKYSVSSWKDTPNTVWNNGQLDNYYLCNVHRMLIVLTLCCKF
jgi:hypothetical protein